MFTSIEIAQQAELRHMRQFMAELDLAEEEFKFYGKFTGKIRLSILDRLADRPDGKLILVTAMSPTPQGEGKTLTMIGIGQALGRIGKRGMITLREPSLGLVFGDLPVCIAKTQSSFSDDPKRRGAPTGWTLTVTDVQLSAGAGFLVVVCGNKMLMPGLGARPAALGMDVTDEGTITGLF